MANKNRRLRVGCWNSRGFSASVPFIRQMLNSNDIFFVSEHWLHANRLHMLGNISDKFMWHGVASKESSEEVYGIRRGQGGVAIFWDNNLKGVSIIETIAHDRICGVRMECENGTVMVFLSVYLPASSSRENLSIILDELAGIIAGLGDNVIPIIGGDFNGDVGRDGGPRGVGQATRAGKMVLRFMEDLNLSAVNLSSKALGSISTYEGHNGSSTIDYIMIPRYMVNNVVSCFTGSNPGLNTSDHLPVEMCLRVDLLPRTIEIQGNAHRLRWDKLNADQMAETYQHNLDLKLVGIMGNFERLDEITPDLIDGTLDEVIQAIHGVAKLIPKSKFVKHLKPYWCEELTILKKRKMHWFNRWKMEGRSNDENNAVRVNMKSSKKEFSKRIRKLSQEYHNEMVANAAEINRRDFWKVMKNLKGKGKSTYNSIKDKNGNVKYELDDVLQVWRDHFDSLSNPKDDPSYSEENFRRVTREVHDWFSGDEISAFLEHPFTIDEVIKVVGKLNSGKTPGHDGITSEHIKYASPLLAEF